MPEQSMSQRLEERASVLGRQPAKRLHEVIAALKTACLAKRAVDLTEVPGFDPKVDPQLTSNLRKLDILNKARAKIRAYKRKKAPPQEVTE